MTKTDASPTSFRLSSDAKERIGVIADDYGISQTAAVELAIRYEFSAAMRRKGIPGDGLAGTRKLAADEFENIISTLNGLRGYYAIIRWGYETPNPIWITGPYESRERAEVDCRFYSDSRGPYGPVAQAAVAGSSPE